MVAAQEQCGFNAVVQQHDGEYPVRKHRAAVKALADAQGQVRALQKRQAALLALDDDAEVPD